MEQECIKNLLSKLIKETESYKIKTAEEMIQALVDEIIYSRVSTN